VQPVSDQRGRADAAPDPDPVLRDDLVAGEPEHAGQRHRGQVVDVGRVEQAAYRLDARDHRGGRDEHDDHDAGQILGPAEAVGVSPGGRPPAERERDRQRHRGQRVGDVVQGVAEQGDRA
jgi:hypothetical protein